MTKVEVLFNPDQIHTKVREIAEKMNKEFSDIDKVIILSVLKGSFIFTADLIRHLDFSFEVAFTEISSYRNNTHSGDLETKSFPDLDFSGKTVIIIEDIVDTGNTINFLTNILIKKKAKSIYLSSIIAKEGKYKINIPFEFPGFFIPDEFVVGYGLDYAGKYRNLPYLGILNVT